MNTNRQCLKLPKLHQSSNWVKFIQDNPKSTAISVKKVISVKLMYKGALGKDKITNQV